MPSIFQVSRDLNSSTITMLGLTLWPIIGEGPTANAPRRRRGGGGVRGVRALRGSKTNNNISTLPGQQLQQQQEDWDFGQLVISDKDLERLQRGEEEVQEWLRKVDKLKAVGEEAIRYVRQIREAAGRARRSDLSDASDTAAGAAAAGSSGLQAAAHARGGSAGAGRSRRGPVETAGSREGHAGDDPASAGAKRPKIEPE